MFRQKIRSQSFRLQVAPDIRQDLATTLKGISVSAPQQSGASTVYVMFGGNTRVTTTVLDEERLSLEVQTKGYFPRIPRYIGMIIERFHGSEIGRASDFVEEDEIRARLGTDWGQYSRMKARAGTQ